MLAKRTSIGTAPGVVPVLCALVAICGLTVLWLFPIVYLICGLSAFFYHLAEHVGGQWVVGFFLSTNFFVAATIMAFSTPSLQTYFMVSAAVSTVYKNEIRDAWKDLKLPYWTTKFLCVVCMFGRSRVHTALIDLNRHGATIGKCGRWLAEHVAPLPASNAV